MPAAQVALLWSVTSSIPVKSQSLLQRHQGKSQATFLPYLPVNSSQAPGQLRLCSLQPTLNAPKEVKYQNSRGIFQWKGFQNHQRLELPFHRWESPPNSRDMISFFFPWLAIRNSLLPIQGLSRGLSPKSSTPVIGSSPTSPLVLGIFIMGLFQPRHKFCQGKLCFETSILSKQRAGIDSWQLQR